MGNPGESLDVWTALDDAGTKWGWSRGDQLEVAAAFIENQGIDPDCFEDHINEWRQKHIDGKWLVKPDAEDEGETKPGAAPEGAHAVLRSGRISGERVPLAEWVEFTTRGGTRLTIPARDVKLSRAFSAEKGERYAYTAYDRDISKETYEKLRKVILGALGAIGARIVL